MSKTVIKNKQDMNKDYEQKAQEKFPWKVY